MKKVLIVFLVVVCLLLSTGMALAAEEITYTVKEGDVLWRIGVTMAWII